MSDDLRTVEQTLSALLAGVRPLEPEARPVADALGRTTVEDVRSRVELPRFDNAAMDGVAVRAADTSGASVAHPVRLELVGTSFAGADEPPPVVGPGHAVTIATGAPVPPGADAVVRVERTTSADGAVLVHDEVRHGTDVRRRAEDLAAGALVLPAGTTLGPAQLAALAGTGHAVVTVHRAPRVAVVLTGDEVAPADAAALGRTQVYDAVGPALAALLADAGASAVRQEGPVGDDQERLTKALADLAEDVDLVVTVGGVSKGARDHLVEALTELGSVSTTGVALRPGKPFRHGRIGDTPVLSLPGNPAAALVAAHAFVVPVLTALLGGQPSGPPVLSATLTEPVAQRTGRVHWLRAVVTEDADGRRVRPAGRTGSAMLHSLALANAWMVLPGERPEVPAGAIVDVLPMWGDGGRASWRPR